MGPDKGIVEQSKLLEMPPSVISEVAFDKDTNTLFVERSKAGNPLLMTWVDRNKHAGIQIKVKPVDHDEIARLREQGLRAEKSEDSDLKMRALALDLIARSAAYGASDMHLMGQNGYSELQIVVHGGLRVLKRFDGETGKSLARAIYQGISQTRDTSYQQLEFQNGQIPGEALPNQSGLSSARIVRGPCYPQAQEGHFMTIRLQYTNTGSNKSDKQLEVLELPRIPDGGISKEELGLDDKQFSKMLKLFDAPDGIIVFTGPTGSGKTTSMHAFLKESARRKPHMRQVTIEDPVEYPMPWAVQMAVTGTNDDQATGKAFSQRIRVALRMAPKTILIGEIRGPEVAIAAIEAAVTGHKCVTTLHVTDPYLVPERIELMDSKRLHRKVFCDHKIIRGLIAQRLLPKLCPDCSKPLSEHPDALNPRIVKALETWGDTSLVRLKGEGCATCKFEGAIGRVGISEIVETDADLMSDFVNHGSDVARANYRKRPDADPSLLERSIGYVLAGTADPQQVEESVDLIKAKG